jgi:transcriptional regulator with XRE-family HTH domain
MVFATFSMESKAMTEFRKNLVEFRKERKLTQMQLADLIDVQPRLISRWETGQSKPQFDHIVQLAEILQVSLDQLVHGEGPAMTDRRFDIRNKRLEELCRQIDALGETDQGVVCHVMDSLIRKEQVKAVMNGTVPHHVQR